MCALWSFYPLHPSAKRRPEILPRQQAAQSQPSPRTAHRLPAADLLIIPYAQVFSGNDWNRLSRCLLCKLPRSPALAPPPQASQNSATVPEPRNSESLFHPNCDLECGYSDPQANESHTLSCPKAFSCYRPCLGLLEKEIKKKSKIIFKENFLCYSSLFGNSQKRVLHLYICCNTWA